MTDMRSAYRLSLRCIVDKSPNIAEISHGPQRRAHVRHGGGRQGKMGYQNHDVAAKAGGE